MTPTKSTVYLPVKEDYDIYRCCYDNRNHEYYNLQNLKQEEGYFFTPEQLNEYTQNVIEQALKTAAENAKIKKKQILLFLK